MVQHIKSMQRAETRCNIIYLMNFQDMCASVISQLLSTINMAKFRVVLESVKSVPQPHYFNLGHVNLLFERLDMKGKGDHGFKISNQIKLVLLTLTCLFFLLHSLASNNCKCPTCERCLCRFSKSVIPRCQCSSPLYYCKTRRVLDYELLSSSYMMGFNL